jgi:hypothetical protein
MLASIPSIHSTGNLTAATTETVLTSHKINHILTIDSCPLPRNITLIYGMKTKFIQGKNLGIVNKEKFEYLQFLGRYVLIPKNFVLGLLYILCLEINTESMFNILVTDHPREDLLTFLEDTYEFIKQGIENGAVLVHWYANVIFLIYIKTCIIACVKKENSIELLIFFSYFGVSRSAAIVIAFTMKKYELTFNEALAR